MQHRLGYKNVGFDWFYTCISTKSLLFVWFRRELTTVGPTPPSVQHAAPSAQGQPQHPAAHASARPVMWWGLDTTRRFYRFACFNEFIFVTGVMLVLLGLLRDLYCTVPHGSGLHEDGDFAQAVRTWDSGMCPCTRKLYYEDRKGALKLT